ncbi:C2H2-type zinc finger transcription factor [Rhizophagus clarus]|uniref:C2H2-type zinc finger transcription factor n=1 Tax=Rhizophagus clarus TaxID=94130 RepID=A0A8H3M5N0_9GLOM|nr:C2H2-type zinc finger transcription factor [Rhizophagus clarus]
MKLNEDVCKNLCEPAYWNSVSKPTLITYLIYLSQTSKDLLQKDKIQSKYISEITKIKRSYKEMDEQYKTVEEALESFTNEKKSEEVNVFWENKHLDQKLDILDKKRKIVEAEGVVNFLQTGNERLNDTSKMVHKSQLNLLRRDEAKKSKNDEQEVKDVDKSEPSTNNEGYFLRKRRNTDYNEERMSKRQDDENEDEDEDGVIIINDVEELCFRDGNPANDLRIGDTNVSQLFRKYQNESVQIAKTEGLFVESNVHEILSLSSIFLLAPGSHSNTMIDILGSPLLNEIHQQFAPAQKIELSSDCEAIFRKVIKHAAKESRHKAIKLLLAELTNNETLNENLGSVILKGLEMLPSDKLRNEPSEITLITNYLDYVLKGTFHDPDKHIVQWPNTALNEIAVIFIGEVSPPSQKTNVYKNCCDLIRLGVFMKDCMDFAVDKGADINVIGFQCVDHTIDFYMIDLVEGIYIMVHIGQVSVPASVKELLSFVDQIEVLLKIREIFKKSFETLCDVRLFAYAFMLCRIYLRTFLHRINKKRYWYRNFVNRNYSSVLCITATSLNHVIYLN